MESRFVVLSILTSLFQVICAITLLAGIVILTNANDPAVSQIANNPFTSVPSNPFAQIPVGVKLAGGALMAFYGLTGLVFSGGVHVLASLDKSTHSISEAVPTIVLSLQKLAANQQNVPSPAGQRQIVTPAIAERPSVKTCHACNSSNDPNGKFCEYCGTAL